MKAILITFDQAHYENIILLLEHHACRGFSYWDEVKGRGTLSGEPHYGSHAWPSMASAIITMVPDETAPRVLESLHKLDLGSPKLGLRAFMWNIESAI